MKNNWQTKTLGEVCEVVAGQSPEGKYYNEEGKGLPFYQGKKEFTEKFLGAPTTWTTNITKVALSNDILMSVRAPVGPINLATEKICIGRGLAAIRANNIDREFLFNFLLNFQSEIVGNKGAVFDSINKSQIESIPLPLPSLPEQRRIVQILDSVFAEIQKAKTNVEKNLANARELFESYLQSVFAHPGEDWENKKLGDKELLQIIDGDRGKNYPTKGDFFSEGYCLFMNTKNVRPDGFDFTTNMFITAKKDASLGNGRLSRNDLVMTTRGTIGNLGLYGEDIPYDHIRINSGMLIFRPNTKVLRSDYLFEVMRSGIIKEQIVQFTTGAAQPQLPIKTLVNFSLPVPKSLNKQYEIVNELRILSASTKQLEAQYRAKLASLEELKKSVLRQAFRGEL